MIKTVIQKQVRSRTCVPIFRCDRPDPPVYRYFTDTAAPGLRI